MPELESAGTGRRDTDEIEITPEMIEAGVADYGLFDPASDSPDAIVRSVYEAMSAARPPLRQISFEA